MADTSTIRKDDIKSLNTLIEHRDAMLAIMKAKGVDPTAFKTNSDSIISEFADMSLDQVANG